MKAVVCPKYGPPEVLELRDVAQPTLRDNDVLVKVQATTVTVADVRTRGFDVPIQFWIPARLFLGIRKPRHAILGSEIAGEIVAMGPAVTNFKVGDRVYALTLLVGFGGYAEYARVPADEVIALAPRNMTAEEAAAVPV